MVVSGPDTGQWTRQKWATLPHDGVMWPLRYEVINGDLYASDVPGIPHQRVVMELCRRIAFPAEQVQAGYGFMSRLAVILSDRDIVQPDFGFMIASRKHIIGDYIYGAPDLIVEVAVPELRMFDFDSKHALYEKFQVGEYGIVDLASSQLHLYRLGSDNRYGEPLVLSADDSITFACLPTITLRVGDLFDGAPK